MYSAELSRDRRGHLGNCMSFVARMMQEMCVACDLPTKCTVQNCLGNVGDI